MTLVVDQCIGKLSGLALWQDGALMELRVSGESLWQGRLTSPWVSSLLCGAWVTTLGCSVWRGSPWIDIKGWECEESNESWSLDLFGRRGKQKGPLPAVCVRRKVWVGQRQAVLSYAKEQSKRI